MSHSIEAVTGLWARGDYINRANHVKNAFFSEDEVDWESLVCTKLNILVPNSTFSSKKVQVNRRFKTSRLQKSPIPRGNPSPLVLGITFALLCFNCTRRPNDREEKGNAEKDDKSVNEQHYSPLQAHKDR